MRLSKALITIAVLSTLTFICLCLVFGYILFGGYGAGKKISIPDYVGLNFADVAEDERFDFETEFIYSDSADEGVIISQDPAPSSQ